MEEYILTTFIYTVLHLSKSQYPPPFIHTIINSWKTWRQRELNLILTDLQVTGKFKTIKH